MQFGTPYLNAIYSKWRNEEQPYRACDLCAYGTGFEGMRYCQHADADSKEKGKPVEHSRSRGGHCGPNAKNLYIAPREVAVTFLDNKSRAAGER